MRWLFVLLLLFPSVIADVIIHGTVYDFALEELPDSVVKISTSPEQVFVAKNASYSFSVPPGDYVLSAKHDKSDSVISENISAISDGVYVLDLILLPSLESEDFLLSREADVPFVEDIVQDKPIAQWLVWIVVFIILAFVVYKISRKQKVAEKIVKEVVVADELKGILDFIVKQGNRTTQKEIRREFPFSEAKISLMIDELESKGLVKRIKKGRGNIVLKT